jgi:glycosyltransferase involved in cell wall biosynthesis
LRRLLFLTESFHPVLGGGERHIRELATALVARGSSATVLTRRSDAGLPAEELLDGVRVLRVGPSGSGRRGKYLMVPGAMRALQRLRGGYDVLVVRGSRVLGLPGLLAGRAHGARVVIQPEVIGELSGEVYTWGTGLDRGPLRPVIGAAVALRNRWLKDADGFVAMSAAIREEMLEAGVAPGKVHLIAHGVDLERFRPAPPDERVALRRDLGLGSEVAASGGVVITFTGRLLRGKGLETLLAAFETLAGRRPELQLLLVGSGRGESLSVEEQLRARVEGSGLASRVRFTGRVDNVEDYLRASDLFVFPSVFEALGLSLLEAAACGLPCIGARTGGIVDVVEHERSGLLFEPGDATALGAAIERLCGDAPLRRELGERTRLVAERRFDAGASRARYDALFRELSP